MEEENLLNGHLSDGGPLYAETHMDWFIKEPFNMLTAAIFIVIALYWLRRLHPHRRVMIYPYLCMIILLIGGVGGTIYHGFRWHVLFLYMDFLPIMFLTLFFSIYLWIRLLPRWYYVLGIIPFMYIFETMVRSFGQTIQAAITLNYIAMGLLIVAPLTVFLYRTRWRHAGLIFGALLSFLLAVSSRWIDAMYPKLSPIGMHFLWHTFGAIACALVVNYWVKIEARRTGVPELG